MAKREVKIGVATYLRAEDQVWSFGMMGDEVDVHASDTKRFDRLNKPFTVEDEAEAMAEHTPEAKK